MIVIKFFAVFNSNVEMEFCRRSVVGTKLLLEDERFFAKWRDHGVSSLSSFLLC